MNTDDLIASCQQEWDAYVKHRFVVELGNGTLAQGAFRHYLQQDYLFLIQFCRAYALAIYKSDDFTAMAKPLAALNDLINHETRLHVDYCRQWGLTEEDMNNIPEAPGTVAYTRLVLDTGQTGSLAELYTALAPCSIGYGHIGRWLASRPDTVWEDNPYRDWIKNYNSADYQEGMDASIVQLNQLLAEIPDNSSSAVRLKKIFRSATTMEIAFWEQSYQGLS